MDQNDFRAAKETGGLVTDAALQSEDAGKIEIEQDDFEPEQEEELEQPEDTEEEQPDDEEDDLPPLTDKEKTAFEKRMERERTKLQQKLEAELEQKYSRHKQIVDSLGGDPDAIERRIRDNQIATEAQRIADANGWDEEQTQYYVEQQKQQQELKELRVQMQVNRLRDNPDYLGIGSMERDILSKIDKTGGALTVEEAYWALGGPKKAEQIRLEAQVRESTKRAQKPRTVLTDSPTSGTGEKPLSPEVMREAERMGISAAEARRLMSREPAQNIDEYRAKNKKAN